MSALNRRRLLAGMLAASVPGLAPQRIVAAPPTISLRVLADASRLRFGSAIDPALFDDPRYVELVTAQCNTIVPRNSLKWSSTERHPGQFNFGEPDRVMAFAAQHQLGVRGHTLVWHNAPDWVKRLSSPADVTDAVTRHVTTLMTRYAGRIGSWDVVNEPFEYDSAELRKSVFLEQLGEPYMDLAFNTARAADPKAELVLNETHVFKQGDAYAAKRQAVLALVDRLQSRHVPIDAVGVQGHYRPGLDKLDHVGFAGFCRDLKSRGLAILLTELDASCRFLDRLPGFALADYGPPFKDLISIAAANGRLSAVMVWGLSPYGLKPNEVKGPNKACTYRINLFDDQLAPLPTFDAVESALSAIRG
ncbi:MAG: endo-1,4-beta-xylanase [Devosia sp.]|nr:endo-1,4-beta-xylanase [Devosia sp.]